MSMSFRTFRKFLLGTIILLCIAIATLFLVLYYQSRFARRTGLWALFLIPCATSACAVCSMVCKAIFKGKQLVAFEAAGLVAFTPFHLMTTLLVVSTSLKLDSTPTAEHLFTALQATVFTTTGTMLTYAAALMVAALLTSTVFDTDVWYRDIDASPSPFPISVLFAFLTPPCLRPAQSLAESLGQVEESRVCLPGACACPAHTHADAEKAVPPAMAAADGSSGSGSGSGGSTPTRQDKRDIPLSHSLVRIPNAVEQRSSIIIAFEMV